MAKATRLSMAFPRRIDPTSGIDAFSFRRRVSSIIITAATTRNAWTSFRAICWLCLRRTRARLLRGACCRIMITCWSKRLTYNFCCTSWVCCTAAPRTLGTAKSGHAAEKFSSAQSNARCGQIRHHWPTLNYVHHNPVRHGYTGRWMDWPWSSAAQYLAQTGLEQAKRIWRAYPLSDYGKDWDEPNT
jgi:hypothetical protein